MLTTVGQRSNKMYFCVVLAEISTIMQVSCGGIYPKTYKTYRIYMLLAMLELFIEPFMASMLVTNFKFFFSLLNNFARIVFQYSRLLSCKYYFTTRYCCICFTCYIQEAVGLQPPLPSHPSN